jgi:hypothetical protein
MLLYIAINTLQAYMAYFTIKIFLELKMEKPFSVPINNIIRKMSRLGLAYSEILFFAGILFLVAQIYQKGIELQQENDMTV